MWSRCLKFYFFSRLTPSRSFLATGNEGSQKKEKIQLPISPFPRQTGGKKGREGEEEEEEEEVLFLQLPKREKFRSVVLV